jgi:hypothetical protein
VGIKISEFGIEVPGKVVRTTDGNTTTLTLNAEQARVVHDATGAVLEFVAQQQELPMGEGALTAAVQEVEPEPPAKGKAAK